MKATGKRRKTGPKAGAFATAQLGEGTRSRTIKSLAETCQAEDLPLPRELPPGEQKMLTATGADGFHRSLAIAQVIPRAHGTPHAAKT